MVDAREVRELLSGLSDPEVRTSAVVAQLLAPMARTWLDTARGRARPEAVTALETWLAAVEVAASLRTRRLSMSAETSADGHSAAVGPQEPHLVDMRELTPDEAGVHLGMTGRHVRRLIGRELAGRRVGRQWLIDPVSVQRFRACRDAA